MRKEKMDATGYSRDEVIEMLNGCLHAECGKCPFRGVLCCETLISLAINQIEKDRPKRERVNYSRQGAKDERK